MYEDDDDDEYGKKRDRFNRDKTSKKSNSPIYEGQIYRGIVRNIQTFGCFVELNNTSTQGLVHVSQLSKDRVEDPNDVVSIGQECWVKVLKIDAETADNKRPKVSLSMKYVSQSDGTDRDANGVDAEQEDRRRRSRQSTESGPVELGAILNTSCTKCGGTGHIAMECYNQGGQRYDLIPEDDDFDINDNSQRPVPSVSIGRGRGTVLPAWMTSAAQLDEVPSLGKKRDKDDKKSQKSSKESKKEKKKKEKKDKKSKKDSKKEKKKKTSKKKDKKEEKKKKKDQSSDDNDENDQSSDSDSDDSTSSREDNRKFNDADNDEQTASRSGMTANRTTDELSSRRSKRSRSRDNDLHDRADKDRNRDRDRDRGKDRDYEDRGKDRHYEDRDRGSRDNEKFGRDRR